MVRCDCSACDEKDVLCKEHPMLSVPICDSCWSNYHNGEFKLENGNECYCRWCGEGGNILMCDTCPKVFCDNCILRNFGFGELQRIIEQNNRWLCFLCSPQTVQDLIIKNGWDKLFNSQKSKKFLTENPLKNNYLCLDITRGREKFVIPVVNEVDSTPAPLDFVYVTKHVSGGVPLTTNPNFLSCCSCTDNCKNPNVCECAQLMGGFAYNADHTLAFDKPSGIYECNQRCSCHKTRCNNRVVGNGPSLPLEVFRCSDNRKGWGVRCQTDIPAGTYITDYIGEIMKELDAEKRGLVLCDEYLFQMDVAGRSYACQYLSELGMKRNRSSIPLDLDIDIALAPESQIQDLIGNEMFDILKNAGVIEKAKDSIYLDKFEDEAETKQNKSSQKKKKLNGESFSSSSSSSSSSDNNNGTNSDKRESWVEMRKRQKSRSWTQARSLLTDRAMISIERNLGSFTIDARWFGSVARFLNHSCQPNLEIVTVFVDSHNIQVPRVAFFTKELIRAKTELCYDYGYYPGNVDGKQRKCLCGFDNCRKILY